MKCPIALSIIAGIVLILGVPTTVVADTDIGDGKLYYCSSASIFSASNSSTLSEQTARKRLKRKIAKLSKKIRSLSKSNKKRKAAVKSRKSLREALKDVASCVSGELESSSRLDGEWNLVTENGLTPAENGFTSLTLSIDGEDFISEYAGDEFSCHWEGTISTIEESPYTVSVLTTVGTGGTFCSQAVNNSKDALVTLSEDSNTLTLDYRSDGGSLQVYGRIS